jgi:hypothetical protein
VVVLLFRWITAEPPCVCPTRWLTTSAGSSVYVVDPWNPSGRRYGVRVSSCTAAASLIARFTVAGLTPAAAAHLSTFCHHFPSPSANSATAYPRHALARGFSAR